MTRKMLLLMAAIGSLGLLVCSATAGDLKASMKVGTPDLQSIGPIAFGPDGILFLSDPMGAAIFAIDSGDDRAVSHAKGLNLAGLGGKVAALLGTTADKILINDMAVNPISGKVYFSVSRGRGPDATPVVMRVRRSGKVEQVSLEGIHFSKAELPNPPQSRQARRGDPRLQSITDIAYLHGRVFIAGLSNEEFASKLRSVPFPFTGIGAGTSIEVYHSAHGKYETRSPVRTFANYKIGDEAYLLAAYTCTPLVKIPIDKLDTGVKIVGTTVAELGNRNRPLDMFVYSKGGKDYILMANSSRGMMKITTDNIGAKAGITERVSGTAGLTYDTLAGLDAVMQLDRLDENRALILVKADEDQLNLETMALP
jgi:hypothetical protein